ncbi:MAG: glycosyltransferase [Verrucomicrobiales bacterium]|nr:glycosyltransferase [Planctomycetota bacterium]MCP5523488.1 glycosyltransferase [Verrucomicrobiales bacterium]
MHPVPNLPHIAFVTGLYPSGAHPNRGTFVHQLVDAVAGQGVRCTVIHPLKLHEWWRERGSGSGGTPGVRVHRPVTLSVSNRQIGGFNTFSLTHMAFQRAVWRSLQRFPSKPDAIYGHFLYSGGAAAVWAGQRLGRPGFVAVGEGTFWTLRPLGVERAKRDFAGMQGALAVSRELQRRLIEELEFDPEKTAAFPNGVDLRTFQPRDREAMRRKHGLPEDQFLVIYVGNFIQPKGVQRVAQALDGMPGVAGMFVGSGPLKPELPNLAFCGRVPHQQVPELLAAADCFILPSDVEGSSNATLEAMACGLPVIVSDRPFNRDLCDPECAVLVDPEDVAGIRRAIQRLQGEGVTRERLARAAVARAAGFDIRQRARNILQWMSRLAGASGYRNGTA